MSEEALSPTQESLWYYADATNQPVGPMPLSKLQHLATVGMISSETLVIEDGGSKWRAFATIFPQRRFRLFRTTPPPPVSAQAASASAPRRWPTILVLIVLVAVIATPILLFVTGKRFASQAASQAKAPNAQPIDRFLGLKEKFSLGDFTYKIESVDSRSSIGPSFARTQASANGVFVIVNYSIKNESNETRTSVSDDFVLRDAKGREFRPASKANTALLMQHRNKDFHPSELQPGLEHETAIAFEIPDDAANSRESLLIVPEKRGTPYYFGHPYYIKLRW